MNHIRIVKNFFARRVRRSITGFAFVLVSINLPGQVGIDVSSPDPSAVLDLNIPAKDKGILIPKVSSAQRELIASPADGLLVYDETQGVFYFWSASQGKWQALNPFTYRKGSNVVDEDDFVISLTNSRSVVIGTVATPAQELEVGGNINASGAITSNTLDVPTGTIDNLTTTTTTTTTTNTTTLSASSTITATGNITTSGMFVGNGSIPLGGIIMWSGVSVPAGWALCDGTNGTPNLSGRFIVGTGLATGPGAGPTTYAMHNRGGAEGSDHTHWVDPPSTSTSSTGGGEGVAAVHEDDGWPGSHSHTVDIGGFSSGGASMTDNRPPFYALAFIMRIN